MSDIQEHTRSGQGAGLTDPVILVSFKLFVILDNIYF